MTNFSHIDSNGKAKMVDVSEKKTVKRLAKAYGKIYLTLNTLQLISSQLIRKGDVLSVAHIAGIIGAKKTSDLIPLCHPLGLESVHLEFKIVEDGIEIYSQAMVCAKTGVEMEALTAVSIAALTIYDMCKAVDKSMIIGDIKLLEKIKEG